MALEYNIGILVDQTIKNLPRALTFLNFRRLSLRKLQLIFSTNVSCENQLVSWHSTLESNTLFIAK